MMIEEAGFNPFVEGADNNSNNNNNNNNNVLKSSSGFDSPEIFSPPEFKKSFSFIEPKSPLPSLHSSSLHSSSHHSLSSSQNSPFASLRVTTPPPTSDNNIIINNNNERKDNQLDNPFFADPTLSSSDPNHHDSPQPLPPSSPLNKSFERTLSSLGSSTSLLARSPSERLVKTPSERVIKSPPERLIKSPSERLFASSSPPTSTSPSVMSPKLSTSSLYTYPSFASSSVSIVTVDKIEWVPDESSAVCEHCASLFTFIKRRHHCRVCGHLFCADCIVKISLPPTLGFTTSQKSCVKCAYKVVRARGYNTATMKSPDGLSIGQKLSGKMQGFVQRMAGMYDGGKFDRFAGGLTSPIQFSTHSIAEVIHLTIPSNDSHILQGRAYVPHGDGPFPLLVYIPGGAFVLADIDSSVVVAFCKELCAKIECIVISIGYRLAPEHKYPVQWEDCYSAVKWIYESATFEVSKVEKDPKVVVCGEGSGGLLAAAVCQMARDRGTPPIKFQLLITPWLNLSNLNLGKFDESLVVTRDLMQWVLKQVFEDSNLDKLYASPIHAASLASLPPTKIITAGYDPLRFEGEEYANKLREAEGNASVTRYENSFHGFVGNYVDSYSESEEALFECVVCLREVFGIGEFKSAPLPPSNVNAAKV